MIFDGSGPFNLPTVGVPWSPKLVKVNGALPPGAVRNDPASGVAPSWTAA
ncbi:hypothetical protein [Streptomyces aureus]|uniref:Uncharacterized protein n=1 Tax=Streptomyces aureus TaxID=193461 RepID=A0ABV4SH61_9ACTN